MNALVRQMNPTALERAVELVAPKYAMKLYSNRLQTMRANPPKRYAPPRGRARGPSMFYDGATRSHRGDGWQIISGGPGSAIGTHGDRLRENAHDLVRNNSHAKKAKRVIINNTVGLGIIPSIDTKKKAKKYRADLEDLLIDHFDTTNCDASGEMNLYGLQGLILGTVIESGECLVRMRRRRSSDGLPLPFQLQVLEPDYIDRSKDGKLPNGNTAVLGLEFDKLGRKVAYWLFKDHPSQGAYQQQSQRIPADTVAHIYELERPGQPRGVTWFAPVIMRMRDFHDLTDAQLLRHKIANCLAAFVSGSDGAYDVNAEETPAGHALEAFEPGMIERLAPGEEVSFNNPHDAGGFSDYASVTLHEIAAGLGISYEALTGDLKGVNFSSGRMGWLEFQRQIDSWRDHMLAPQLLSHLARWFIEAATVVGKIKPGDRTKIKWTAPRREMISPKDEVPFEIASIRAGLTSKSDIIRRRGHDPEAIEEEIALENERGDSLGLISDSDPRQRTKNGSSVVLPTDGDDDNDDNSEPSQKDEDDDD